MTNATTAAADAAPTTDAPTVDTPAATPIRLALMGDGRMGTLVRQLAEAATAPDGTPAFRVVAQAGEKPAELESADAADVLVDFSNASCLPHVLAYARRTGCAVVSGTTGYDDAQAAELADLARTNAVLHSGNFSLGVACLRHAVALAARELAGFDVEVVECHHNQKVDAPSGTANLLVDAVRAARVSCGHDDLVPTYGRHGMCGARDPREIGVHSLRGGTVAGTHTVSLFGPDEEVSLTHRAGSRRIFATGAVEAARRMAGRPAGTYDFDSVMFGGN